MDETPVAESEGKRSSMGQMVPAGCARDTVPARLYKRRLQCWVHGTILHVTSSNVAVSTLKAPFTHDTLYFTVLIWPPPAPVFLPNAAGNHLSGTVRSMFPRHRSFPLPRSADFLAQGSLTGFLPLCPAYRASRVALALYSPARRRYTRAGYDPGEGWRKC